MKKSIECERAVVMQEVVSSLPNIIGHAAHKSTQKPRRISCSCWRIKHSICYLNLWRQDELFPEHRTITKIELEEVIETIGEAWILHSLGRGGKLKPKRYQFVAPIAR